MLSTPRLLLRSWRPEDRAPFGAMNGDPVVMRYFPSLLTEAETDAMLARNQAHFVRHGFGLWATELVATGEFIGFIGLAVPEFASHFTPCVEVGWRLAAPHWNQGLATEGAAAVLHFGFTKLGIDEIVAMTAVENRPSRRVMEKLGMQQDAEDDFDHPKVAEGHPLRRHVLYRKQATAEQRLAR